MTVDASDEARCTSCGHLLDEQPDATCSSVPHLQTSLLRTRTALDTTRSQQETLLRTLATSIDDLRQATSQATADARTQILTTIEEMRQAGAQGERQAYDRGIAVCIGECQRQAVRATSDGADAAWTQAAEALRALYGARQMLSFADDCPSCGRTRELDLTEPTEPICPGWGSEDCLTATVARFDHLHKEELAWRLGLAHAKEALGADAQTDIVDAIVDLRERDKLRGEVLARIRQSDNAKEPWLAELLRLTEQ